MTAHLKYIENRNERERINKEYNKKIQDIARESQNYENQLEDEFLKIKQKLEKKLKDTEDELERLKNKPLPLTGSDEINQYKMSSQYEKILNDMRDIDIQHEKLLEMNTSEIDERIKKAKNERDIQLRQVERNGLDYGRQLQKINSGINVVKNNQDVSVPAHLTINTDPIDDSDQVRYLVDEERVRKVRGTYPNPPEGSYFGHADEDEAFPIVGGHRKNNKATSAKRKKMKRRFSNKKSKYS